MLTEKELYEIQIYRFIDAQFKDEQLKYILLGVVSRFTDDIFCDPSGSKDKLALKVRNLSKMRIIFRKSLKMINRSIHETNKMLMKDID